MQRSKTCALSNIQWRLSISSETSKRRFMWHESRKDFFIKTLKTQILDKPRQCSGCSKTFKRSNHVRSHVKRMHSALASSLKKIECEKCDVRVTRSCYLSNHDCSSNSRCMYVPSNWILSFLIRNSINSFLETLRALLCKFMFLVFSQSTSTVKKSQRDCRTIYESKLESDSQRT